MSHSSARGAAFFVGAVALGGAWQLAAAPSKPTISKPSAPKTALATLPPQSMLAKANYETAPGELVLRDNSGKEVGICPLKHTDVKANIAGFVGRVHVRQTFQNTAKTPVEAVYTFPLPADAAVDDMKMVIGKRVVRGQIKKREEARQIYEAAKSAGQAAALLDQERPNIFTQAVANLMPGQDVTIEISFTNLLKYDDGVYQWAFPTVVGPRYTGGTSAGTNPGKITPPITAKGTRAGHDIAIEVNLDAGLPLREITSPLHPIDVQKRGATRANIQLRDMATLPNKDFILRYKVAGEQVQGGVIAYAPSGNDGGFFTIVLQPPAAPAAEDVAPKEMVFVIDQTGSQSGAPVAKAKETISYALQNLNADDTFQLIGFNTEVFPCFPAPVPANAANVAKALEWLKPIEGSGGTDILKSMDYALKIPGDRARPRIICYMTDGYVGNDAQIIQHIAKNRGEVRIFPFGTGNSVNRYLIEGMAREGRGEADIITLDEDGKAIAKRFYNRIAQPLLLDVSVDWGGLPVQDVLPKYIPDVFSEKPIILKGRYKYATKGAVTLKGLLRGKPWQQIIPIDLPDTPSESGEALPSLWARSKMDDIEIDNYQHPAGNAAAQITDLALEYRLMSAYTSFVAVEQRVVNVGGQQRTVNVPVEMPDGVSYEGIFGEADETATAYFSRGVTTRFSRAKSPMPSLRGAIIAGSGGGGGALGLPMPAGATAARPAPPTTPLPALNAPVIHSPQPNAIVALKSLLDSDEKKSELAFDSEVIDGTAAAQKKLAAMKPDERRAALRKAKLAPALQKTPLPGVKNGKIEIQIWLNALPSDGLAKLKALGFDLAATLTPKKLLLGTISVKQLDALSALSFVRRIEPPNFG